jgi:hypothetical protein
MDEGLGIVMDVPLAHLWWGFGFGLESTLADEDTEPCVLLYIYVFTLEALYRVKLHKSPGGFPVRPLQTG